MKTDRKTIVLMAAVLIACMCVCMATKEGLKDDSDPCKWIIMKGEQNTRNCDDCPHGKIMTKLEKRVGKGNLDIVEFTCGEAA